MYFLSLLLAVNYARQWSLYGIYLYGRYTSCPLRKRKILNFKRTDSSKIAFVKQIKDGERERETEREGEREI
mgnify:CR=1 FL=1